MQSDKIRIKVSVVVVLIDDFTDKVIPANQVRVRIWDEKKPIIKGEGYFVFTNVSKEVVTIETEAFSYQKRVVTADLSKMAAGMSDIRLRLVPNCRYKLPEKTTVLKGTLPAGEEPLLVFRNNSNPLRLMQDYKKGDGCQIRLYNSTGISLEARACLIATGKHYDVAKIREAISSSAQDDDCYELEKPLEHEYKKAETTIHLLHQVIADEKGHFEMPVANLMDKGGEVLCERVEGKKLTKKWNLRYGCENEIEFL